MGFTSTTVKYILFFFNFFIAICGAAIVGTAVYIWRGDQKTFSDLTKDDITTPCIILAIAGAFVFLVAFLGCCGAIQESHCMMILYAIILVAVLFIEAAVVGLAYVKKNKVQDAYKTAMNSAFMQYDINHESIDAMQEAIHCCGTTGPQFYMDQGKKVPDSCHNYETGCIEKFTEIIKDNLQKLIHIAIGVGIAEVIAIIFGLYYASHIRRYRDRGYA